MGRRLITVSDPKMKMLILTLWKDRRSGMYNGLAGLRRFTSEWRKKGWKISPRTLYHWEREYAENGMTGLRDGRSTRLQTVVKETPFVRAVARLYFGRPTAALCYRLVQQQAAEKGWQVPSKKSVTTALAKLRLERLSRAY